MRTIKFDTIHRAFTGPDNTWPGRQNAELKNGGGEAPALKSPSRESVSVFVTPPGCVPNKEHGVGGLVAVGPTGTAIMLKAGNPPKMLKRGTCWGPVASTPRNLGSVGICIGALTMCFRTPC